MDCVVWISKREALPGLISVRQSIKVFPVRCLKKRLNAAPDIFADAFFISEFFGVLFINELAVEMGREYEFFENSFNL